MKKLLTLLLVLVISTATYAVDNNTKYWVGGASGSWNTASNWYPSGVPGSTNMVVFGGKNNNIITSGTVTVTGLADGTIIQGMLIQGYFVLTSSGSYVANRWYGTNVVLQGAIEGADLHVHYGSIPSGVLTAQSKYYNKLTIMELPITTVQFWGTPNTYNTLDCTTSGATINLLMDPKTLLYDGGRDYSNANFNKYKMGHLYEAFYPDDCQKNSLHSGLVLESDASGHAELVQAGDNDDKIIAWVSASLTVMSGTGSSAHLVCAPITSTNEVGYMGSDPSWYCRSRNCQCVFNYDYVRYWETPLQDWAGWLQIAPGETCLTSTDIDYANNFQGKGFEVFIHQNANKLWFGELNNKAYTGGILDYYTFPNDISDTSQYELLGNPFPSGLSFAGNTGSTTAGWAWGTDLYTYFAYWDPALNGGLGKYRYYEWTLDVHDTAGPGFPVTGLVIPRGQGFWVASQSVSASNSWEIKVNNLAREFNGTVNIKEAPVVTNNLSIALSSVSRNCIASDMNIKFGDMGSAKMVKGDVGKLFNSYAEGDLYTKSSDGKNVSVKCLQPVSGTATVPVFVKANNTASMKFGAGNISSFNANAGIILVDRKTNTTQDLRINPEYTFTTTVGDDDHRFDILFSNVLNGVNDQKGSAFKIYSSGKSIVIVNDQTNGSGSVTICDMLGRELMQKSLSYNTVNNINTNLSTGYYIVTVRNNNSASTQKVYIN